MEELKKLARMWKLNERRNFWKTHAERSEMVVALLEHAEQNLNYTTKKLNLETNSEFLAAPPTENKPSNQTGRNFILSTQLKNYCGKKVRMLIFSTLFTAPTPTSTNKFSSYILNSTSTDKPTRRSS